MENKMVKNLMLRARIRSMDRDVLELICNRRGLTLSEGVRQAIRNEAEREGLYGRDGIITIQEPEAQNGNRS